MPEIIWKTDDSDNQFRLFEICVNEAVIAAEAAVTDTEYDDDYFIFYVSVMIKMMNYEASLVFADFCFCDNYWEILDEDKIDFVYRKVIIENINKLSYTECYKLLYELNRYCVWTDETDEVFTNDKLKRINDLTEIKKKLYYAISDHIVYRSHIEIIPHNPCYIRKRDIETSSVASFFMRSKL
jgi:hypothetical protein